MMKRLSDFRKCSGLLLLLLFLALDGITSPMQEKLFKEYGVSKSPDWQDWLSSLTSSNVFYFVHLWTSVRAQRVFLHHAASVCWVCWSWKVQSDHVGQSVLSDCINHHSPEFRPRSDTNQTARYGLIVGSQCSRTQGTGSLVTAISFCTKHPALLGDAMTLSVAQDWFEDDMIQPCSSMYIPETASSRCSNWQFAWLLDFEDENLAGFQSVVHLLVTWWKSISSDSPTFLIKPEPKTQKAQPYPRQVKEFGAVVFAATMNVRQLPLVFVRNFVCSRGRVLHFVCP